ncbi:hypothetical protein DB88DRAFT_477546 [Papiliotrema laurentii]|uniref:Uncharacterized protein n=1 Tax=Papiliotrema laurentii TaxID=5418 RepID=A0AAD9L997_PAPLA|nr:hypothetical protein DB88DRAFT_477546 [Papiliotrema laurentii]
MRSYSTPPCGPPPPVDPVYSRPVGHLRAPTAPFALTCHRIQEANIPSHPRALRIRNSKLSRFKRHTSSIPFACPAPHPKKPRGRGKNRNVQATQALPAEMPAPGRIGRSRAVLVVIYVDQGRKRIMAMTLTIDETCRFAPSWSPWLGRLGSPMPQSASRFRVTRGHGWVGRLVGREQLRIHAYPGRWSGETQVEGERKHAAREPDEAVKRRLNGPRASDVGPTKSSVIFVARGMAMLEKDLI